MATKKTKSETAAPSQPVKAQKKAAAPKAAAKVEPTPVKKTAAPKAAKAPKAAPSKETTVTKPTKTKAPAITAEAIALRAYYIAEERYRTQTPGSPSGDWLEAERQLLAEAKPGSKKAPAKAAN